MLQWSYVWSKLACTGLHSMHLSKHYCTNSACILPVQHPSSSAHNNCDCAYLDVQHQHAHQVYAVECAHADLLSPVIYINTPAWKCLYKLGPRCTVARVRVRSWCTGVCWFRCSRPWSCSGQKAPIMVGCRSCTTALVQGNEVIFQNRLYSTPFCQFRASGKRGSV